MTPAEITRRFRATPPAAPDRDLLARYAATGDGEAFALLVRRFGPLVLGTCRRVLGPADADDAFQAVFLALARRAATFRDATALPAWLHRVALRTARRASVRPRPRPLPPDTADTTDPFANVTWKDVRRVLDEELDRLPEAYRGPVVLCWLDGLTRDEAAARLGVSLTTVKRRLDAGRELLRTRLLRRGLGPAMVAVVALDPVGLRAVVSSELHAAAAGLVGPGAAVPARVAALAAGPVGDGTVRAVVVAAVAVVATVAAGAVAGQPAPVVAAPGVTASVAEPVPVLRPADRPGDPRPAGVTAQFGSLPLTVPDEIMSATFSPDGRRLAVVSSAQIRVYEVAAWKLVHRFSVPGGGFRLWNGKNLAFSPDGAYLGFVNPGHDAGVWDLRTGKLLSQFRGGPAYGWDPDANKFVTRHPDSPQWSSFCAFTPDGAFALSEKERLSFHDPATGKELRSLPVGRVIHLSPDGKRFVRLPSLKSDSPQPIIGDTTTGKTVHALDSATRWGDGRDGVAFSPDGKQLALALANTWGIELWDTTTWAEPTRLPTPDSMFSPTPTGGPDVGFTADGKVLFLRLRDGDLARWDAKTHKELPRLRAGTGPALGVAYGLPGGTTMFLPCPNGWVRVFDTATGAEKTIPGRYREPLHLIPTPDGAMLAAGDGAGRIDLLDAATGERARTIREEGDRVSGMVLSPDGTSLAVSEWSTPDGTLESRVRQARLLRVADGKELRVFGDPSRNVHAINVIGFSPDGTHLLLDFFPRHVRTFELDTGKEVRRHELGDFAASLSPDRRLFAKNYPAEVQLIDVATGEMTRRVDLQPQQPKWPRGARDVYRFAWSADGKTLACLITDDIAVILDPRTGRELRRFPASPSRRNRPAGMFNWVQTVALSPDGKHLLTAASSDQAAGVWDTATGKAVARLDHGFPVQGGFFTADGQAVVTVGRLVGYRWDLAAVLADRKK